MAKKDDIILIIAKAFGKQKFTREDTEISKTLSMTTLISEFGLTSEQAYNSIIGFSGKIINQDDLKSRKKVSTKIKKSIA